MMNVPMNSCILDKRCVKSFTIQTYSGYKKIDVVKQFSKALTESKLESACHWMVELHISGKTDIIWNELFPI